MYEDIQFGVTMQECTTSIMLTHDHTDDVNIVVIAAWFRVALRPGCREGKSGLGNTVCMLNQHYHKKW